MGIMDKVKFWKKEDNLGDLSDLGDFGLDSGSKGAAPIDDLGGLGPMPSFDEPAKPSVHDEFNPHREDVQPTQASMQMGDQLGIRPQQATAASTYPQQPQAQQTRPAQQQQYAQPAQQYPPPQQAYRQEFDMGDLSKDVEIIHAKLDAIKSSLDSINQRLATLERMASPETKNRYSW